MQEMQWMCDATKDNQQVLEFQPSLRASRQTLATLICLHDLIEMKGKMNYPRTSWAEWECSLFVYFLMHYFL